MNNTSGNFWGNGANLFYLYGCILFWLATSAQAQYPSGPQVGKDGTAIAMEDYATFPVSSRGSTNPVPPYNIYLARLNFLRSEPASAPLSSNRFFVIDMNRNLYLLDKANRSSTAYLNFERIFPHFDNDSSYGDGLGTLVFDPAYASNGKFYTSHMENPSLGGSAVPTNGATPGLNLAGYSTTTTLAPPAGSVARESVIVEWTDTNISNGTFEGTAREILRIGSNSQNHPVGDMTFDPVAMPGSDDYRNLYITVGDAAQGETSGGTHTLPQRLDTLEGKVLRITPDISLRTGDLLSGNGRYRIPSTGDANPFVSISLAGARKEIFAYGFRNPHRFAWDPVLNKLFLNDIGLHSWEEVNIVVKGGNYGYAEREGIEQLFVGGANDGKTGSQTSPVTPFPAPDSLTVNGLASPVTPLYPVAEYSHEDGDAISSGFVYRGNLLPGLRGKYIFGDITAGRIFYSDANALVAADDGNRTTLAAIHELQIVYHGGKRRLFDVVSDAYYARGGSQPGRALPGNSPVTNGNDPEGTPYGGGRVDLRLALGGDGEIYVLSKSDGIIRKFTGMISPPAFASVLSSNGQIVLTWPTLTNRQYQVQWKANLASGAWSNLGSALTATFTNLSKVDATTSAASFYRVALLP